MARSRREHPGGRQLLAHELAHAVQQDAAPLSVMRQASPAAASPTPTQQAAPKSNVISIDPITGPSTSALTSFSVPGPDCNLNAPGPLNNTTTGSCKNIQQVLFHLAGISSQDVILWQSLKGQPLLEATKIPSRAVIPQVRCYDQAIP